MVGFRVGPGRSIDFMLASHTHIMGSVHTPNGSKRWYWVDLYASFELVAGFSLMLVSMLDFPTPYTCNRITNIPNNSISPFPINNNRLINILRYIEKLTSNAC